MGGLWGASLWPAILPTPHISETGKLPLPVSLIGHTNFSSGRAAEHHVVKEDYQRSTDYRDDELNDKTTRATTAT